MTYVEYMRRLGVSVEPEVKPKVVPTVEPLPLLGSFRYQSTLDGYASRLPSRRTTDLQIAQRSLPLLRSSAEGSEHAEYYRRALLAVEAELAHRNGIPL
jgi:hypothetical protein